MNSQEAWALLTSRIHTPASGVLTIGIDGSALSLARVQGLGPIDYFSVDMSGPPPYSDPVTMKIVVNLQQEIIQNQQQVLENMDLLLNQERSLDDAFIDEDEAEADALLREAIALDERG